MPARLTSTVSPRARPVLTVAVLVEPDALDRAATAISAAMATRAALPRRECRLSFMRSGSQHSGRNHQRTLVLRRRAVGHVHHAVVVRVRHMERQLRRATAVGEQALAGAERNGVDEQMQLVDEAV